MIVSVHIQSCKAFYFPFHAEVFWGALVREYGFGSNACSVSFFFICFGKNCLLKPRGKKRTYISLDCILCISMCEWVFCARVLFGCEGVWGRVGAGCLPVFYAHVIMSVFLGMNCWKTLVGRGFLSPSGTDLL